MKKYIFTLFLLLTCLADSTAWAADVPNLYQGEVPVTGTAPADWQQAMPRALAQVLVKVSMNPKIVQLPPIAKSLTKGTNLVQSYNYVMATSATGHGQTLQVRFSPKGINQLLQTANQPVLARERPLTLVWLVEQNGANQPKLFNTDKASFQKEADAVAMPLLWPSLDAQDLAALTTEQLWSLNQTAIQQAAKRYQAENILVGKISKQGNMWQGQWLRITTSGVKPLQTQGTSVNLVFAAAVAQLGQMFVAEHPAPPVAVDTPSPVAAPAVIAPKPTSTLPPITTSVATPPGTQVTPTPSGVPVIDESLVIIPPGSSNGVAQSFPTDGAPTQFVPDDGAAPTAGAQTP